MQTIISHLKKSIYYFIILLFSFPVLANNIKANNDCIYINNIGIKTKNNKKINNNFYFTNSIINKYKNKCLSQKDINNIISDLTKEALSRGYVTTRFYIQKQSLKSKTLTIIIVPGYISKINTQSPKDKLLINTTFPTKSGDILDMQKIEQGLDQINTSANLKSSVKLLPGNKLGETNILVQIEKTKKYSLYTSIDNYGSKSISPWNINTGINLYNIMGLSETLSFNFKKTENNPNKYSNSFDFNYSLAFRNYNFNIKTSFQKRNISIGDTKLLNNSNDFSLTISRILFRSNHNKLYADFTFNNHLNKSYINRVENKLQNRFNSSAELSIRYTKNINNSLINTRISHRKGVPWFGSQKDKDLGIYENTLMYNLTTLDFNISSLINFFSKHLTLESSLHLQYTDDPVYSTEMIYIGGPSSVHGYGNDYSLNGKKGTYLKNKISYPLETIHSSIYLGIDYGKIFNLKANNHLAGAFIGLQTNIKGFYSDLYLSTPLIKYDNYLGRKVNFGINIRYNP